MIVAPHFHSDRCAESGSREDASYDSHIRPDEPRSSTTRPYRTSRTRRESTSTDDNNDATLLLGAERRAREARREVERAALVRRDAHGARLGSRVACWFARAPGLLHGAEFANDDGVQGTVSESSLTSMWTTLGASPSPTPTLRSIRSIRLGIGGGVGEGHGKSALPGPPLPSPPLLAAAERSLLAVPQCLRVRVRVLPEWARGAP